MKRKLVVLCSLLCILLFGGCGHKQKTEIVVFAAASMTETLTELGERYMQEHEDISIVFSFESSGTLKTQIEEGAVCDIFISAGQKQMNQLEEIGELEEGTRLNLLENKVALAVPDGNPKGILSYEDLKSGLENRNVLLAMGNADVPVGQYTEKILMYFALDQKALETDACVTYGSNVKEVTTQILEGLVDCGIIYATDAFSAGLTVVDVADAEMCGQVIYPAALMKRGEQFEAAKAFLSYLTSDEADEVFENVGFTPMN